MDCDAKVSGIRRTRENFTNRRLGRKDEIGNLDHVVCLNIFLPDIYDTDVTASSLMNRSQRFSLIQSYTSCTDCFRTVHLAVLNSPSPFPIRHKVSKKPLINLADFNPSLRFG